MNDFSSTEKPTARPRGGRSAAVTKATTTTEPAKPSKARNKKIVIAQPAPRMATAGIDVADKKVQICEIDLDGVVSEARIPNNAEKLKEYFDRTKRRIVLEMGTHTRWISELLEKLGHEVLIVDPRHIPLISKTLYKSDKVDAETLALLGYENAHRLKTIPVRPLEHQKALTMVRARASAVAGRTRIVNTIRGLLKPYGLRAPKDGSTAKFLQDLWVTLEGHHDLLNHIIGLMFILKTMNEQIYRYDAAAEHLLPVVAPDAVPLTEIPGVGALTALYFAAIVGDPSRFSDARDLGPYLGLCRRRDDSGDYTSEMRITKAGDRYMRALLANCASHILGPFGVDSDIRRWGLKKVGGGTRAEKRKAKVAVARKLAVVMLTLWKSKRRYDRFHHSKEKNEVKPAA